MTAPVHPAVERPINQAFMLLANLAHKRGVKGADLPGCWECEIPGIDGGTWWWAVNGKDEPRTPTGRTIEVPPYHCYLEWCGWPAGIFTPFGGEICAGSVANEDAFIAALQAAIERWPTPRRGAG